MESCQFAIFQRIEAGVRREERRYGLGETGLAYLLRENLAEAPYRHASKWSQDRHVRTLWQSWRVIVKPWPLPQRSRIWYNLHMSKLHLGVLGSGAGSNMQSIVDAIEAGTLDAEIKLVLAAVADAKILDRAKRHNIPCQ